jgi:hypothetical protein
MAYAHIGTILAAPLAERSTQPSLFKRIVNAMIESRMRQAQREIRSHAHLLHGPDTVLGDMPKMTLQNDGQLPFIR